MLDLEKFLEIFDKLLMDSGDNYEVVYVSSDNEENHGPGSRMNLNLPQEDNAEEDMAVTSRNFSKKQGHRQQQN